MSRGKPLCAKVVGDSIHVGEQFSVSFQRTLRIPDDSGTYPLPPGLGLFPLRQAKSEVLLPIYQREALWMSFDGGWPPHAVKVGIGGIDAVSGEPFDPTSLDAESQDYLVTPTQPWLDGINAGEGFVRQFVAMPLGAGYTVEGQLTGAEREGGIQLVVIPPKPGRFPDKPPFVDYGPMDVMACAAPDMGLAAGGRMEQEIYPDEFGIDTWDLDRAITIDVRLCNSMDWRELTGEEPPPTPVSAELYTEYGFPWFRLYEERGDLAPAERLTRVKSVREVDHQHGFGSQQDDTTVTIPDDQVVAASDTPLETERFSSSAHALKQFPQAEQVAGGEGCVIYFAERDGGVYAITDEGTMADFLDPEDADLADALCSAHRFSSPAARSRWLARTVGH